MSRKTIHPVFGVIEDNRPVSAPEIAEVSLAQTKAKDPPGKPALRNRTEHDQLTPAPRTYCEECGAIGFHLEGCPGERVQHAQADKAEEEPVVSVQRETPAMPDKPVTLASLAKRGLATLLKRAIDKLEEDGSK